MKRTNILKRFSFAFTLFAAATLSLTSCKEKPADTEEVAEEQNEEKFDDNSQENDAEFLVFAAEMDLMDIQLGKLALNSSNSEIKAHGQMMVDEHTKASNDLKALASAKAISIPASLTEDGMDKYNKLAEKKAEDFDKAYIDEMVDIHEKAVNKFERNADRTEDPDIKTWAGKTLQSLRTHLEHSRALKDKLK